MNHEPYTRVFEYQTDYPWEVRVVSAAAICVVRVPGWAIKYLFSAVF